jgi:hypothetical protein
VVRVGTDPEPAYPNVFQANVNNSQCAGFEDASMQFFDAAGNPIANPPRFNLTFVN